MRIAIVGLLVLGCSEPLRCERTAEDERGTCPEGYVCGGEGFRSCEPGSLHCVCMDAPDGGTWCGVATCVRR
jgi:hypothetical protein